MGTRIFAKAAGLAVTLLMLSAGMAFADTVIITNDVGLNTNAAKVPGATGTAYVSLAVTNGTPPGDQTGCNANGANPLIVNLQSDDADLTIDSPGYVTITGCGVDVGIGYSVSPSSGGGDVHISVASLSGGVPSTISSPRLYNTSDTLTVTISAPANTPPSVSVTGVTDGSSYNKGSVPVAGCDVVDAEDGNSSFLATLSAITGPDAFYGIGSQTASCSYTDGGGLFDSDSATYDIVDPSAPSISYVLNPASPGGNNGWYVSNVTLTWTVTEPNSPSTLVKTGCVDQTITADQLATTYSCSATSDGGSAGPVDVTIKRDATAPYNVSGAPNRSPDSNGWYNHAVDVAFAGTDDTSGIDSCSTINYSGPDSASASAQGHCTDLAGNSSSDVASSSFQYDATDPTVQVTGVTDGATYVLGSVPAAGCDPQDNLSGVASGGTLSLTGGTPNGVGSFLASCSAPTDDAGNTGDAASAAYNVIYDPAGISGILQPINPDNTSVFKRGQAVPVKFKLAGDEYFGFNTTNWTIQRQSVACAAFDGLDATLENVGSNTPTSYFRYDASADQYIYNADMHTLGVGTCWNFKVTLDSGQVMYSAVFKLAK